MLEDEAQTGELLHPFRQVPVDESLLTIENIDVRVGVLAMHQERHVDLFHALQHGHDFFIIGDAGRRIGRGIGRVKFYAGEQPVAKAALDVVGIGVVGEIAGQERLEFRILRYRRHLPLAIGGAVGRGAHRRDQVRHQDGAAEMHFGRAILMPNLIPPVRTTADCAAYREREMAAIPKDAKFKPLLTCYLTDDTDPDDVERGFRDGLFTGVKLYPANATTNSAAGVTDYKKVMPVLERMEKIGMPFLMHGEDTDPDVDIFDREKAFIDRYLSKWVKQFPGLRFILEHLSSKEGADYVKSAAPQVGGTITHYHMMLTRNDWFGHGLKPYMYVMPVIKTARDRTALRKAATSGGVLFPRHRFRA